MTRFVLAVGCLLAGCATTRASVVDLPAAATAPATPRARSTRGANVRFEGNEQIPRDRLLDAMQWDDPDRDDLRLAGVYWDLGYVRARVDAPVVANGITTYRIHEGRRYRIGKIEVRDVDAHGAHLTTPDGLPTRAHIHARPGQWFDRQIWVHDVAAVKALYRDVGYPLVEVQMDTPVDDARGTVDVKLTAIDLGTRVTIERVEVVVSPAADEARARAAIDVRAGELYDASKIEAARQRLLATGRWAKVEVSYGGIPATFPPSANA